MKTSIAQVLCGILSEKVDSLAMEELIVAIEKMISDGFVRKELYKEKLSEIADLKQINETATKDFDTAKNDADAYKLKYETLESEIKKEKDEIIIKQTNEKINKIATDMLLKDGANSELVSLLIKAINKDEISININEDGIGAIENWALILDKLKSDYPAAFNDTFQSRVNLAPAPLNFIKRRNPWMKVNFDIDEQTKVYKENPAMAKEMALSAGIVL